MNIIEQGLQSRSDEVFVIAHEEEGVVAAEDRFWNCYNKVIELYGHTDLLGELETCVVDLEMNSSHASYRIGVSDGMVLQQEINLLTKSRP